MSASDKDPINRVLMFARNVILIGLITVFLMELALGTTRRLSMNMNVLGSGHWNEEGHRAAGELIARYLCRRPADDKAGALLTSSSNGF